MNTLDIFRQKKREILHKIVYFLTHQELPTKLPALSDDISNLSEEGTTQMINAFLGVLEDVLNGDQGAAKEYLSLILPPLKDGGLPLSLVVRSVPSMFSIIAVALGEAHLTWVANYSQTYTDEILEVWGA